jgi:hypothetical protein
MSSHCVAASRETKFGWPSSSNATSETRRRLGTFTLEIKGRSTWLGTISKIKGRKLSLEGYTSFPFTLKGRWSPSSSKCCSSKCKTRSPLTTYMPMSCNADISYFLLGISS